MTGDATELQPPSWWKYVGGREADGMWAKAYVALRREGREIPAQDLSFYLAAIERLSADAYPRVPNRPLDRMNFWLACHYRLGAMLVSESDAALQSVKIAREAGVIRGRDCEAHAKVIRRHANRLTEPVDAFLLLLINLPPPRSKQVSARQRHAGLMKWIEREKVRKVG